MHPTRVFSFLLGPCFLAASALQAQEPQVPASTANDPAGAPAEIQRIERELEEARRAVAELESELQRAREQQVASTAPATERAGMRDEGTHDRISGRTGAAVAVGSALPAEPGAVTRVDTAELYLGGVQDLSRLEFLVPGFRYGQTGHDARISMRGARTNSVGPEANSVAGVFEDGIYLPTSTMRMDSFLDVEAVEVLRGPQITRFGQHAYAGAVNIVTHRPAFDAFAGVAEAENSIPDRTIWRAVLNVPISDTLAFRVAGLSESRSGWINNFFLEPDSDDLNDRKEQTLRSSLLWQPTDDFSVLLWRRYQDENGTGTAPWGYQQVGAYVGGELLPGHQFAPEGSIPDEGPWDVYRNFISSAQFEHELNTLDVNWTHDAFHLQWLSNYARFEGAQVYDNDYSTGGSATGSGFAGWGSEDSSWSSELRLSSSGDGPFGWLAGFYWSERDSEWTWLEAFNGLFAPAPWDVPGEYSLETKAAFGQVSYAFADRWTLTGGLRWNEDTRTYKTGEQGSWDDVLWKAALQFDLDSDTMAWFSVSTGYLPGGINTVPGVNPAWEPEKLTAYEAGLRGSFASELSLSVAAWFNNFDDVQSQAFVTLPEVAAPESSEYTGNGGSMSARGVEVELEWMPLPAWQIATNLAWTEAEFDHYVAPNLPGLGDIPGHTQGGLLSYENWHPALTPQWVIGVQTSWSVGIGRWGTLMPYLQSTYAGSYYASDLNLEGVRQDDHVITDFRMIWQPTSRFQVQLYYLNLGDEAALNWAQVYSPRARPDITTLQGNWTIPSTQGILFNYTF